MELLAQVPINTLDFMIAGYTVILGVMLVYIVSLVVRRRNLNRDLETLREFELDK